MIRKHILPLVLAACLSAGSLQAGGPELTSTQKELWDNTKARLEQVYARDQRRPAPMTEEELDAFRLPLKCGEDETGPLPWDLRLLLGFDRHLVLADQEDDDQLFRFILSEDGSPPEPFTPDGLIDFLEDLSHYSNFYPLEPVLMRQAFFHRGLGLPVVLDLSQLGGDELPGLWLAETPSGNTPVVHFDYDDFPEFYIRSTSLLDYVAINATRRDRQMSPKVVQEKITDPEAGEYHMARLFIEADSIKGDLTALAGPLAALNAALADTLTLNTGTDGSFAEAGPEQIKAWLEEMGRINETSGEIMGNLAAYKEAYTRGNLPAGFFVEYIFRLMAENKMRQGFSPNGWPRSVDWGEVNRRSGGAEVLKRLADEGLAEAQLLYGDILNMGLAAREMNRPEAAAWFLKAAEQGLTSAQNALGTSYQFGQGVDKSVQQAAWWYNLAAERGYAPAMVNLAMLYVNENMADKYAESVEWLKKAVDLGRLDARYCLAYFYVEGLAVKQDYAEAARLVRPAAEQGYPQAQSLLGNLLVTGLLGEPDYEEGLKLLKSAAGQGEERAQYYLASM